jgi:hypothetical protein
MMHPSKGTHYGVEKFDRIADSLQQPFSAHQCLENAVLGSLHCLQSHDLPVEIREDFKRLRERLTRINCPDEGSFKATIAAMSHREVAEVTEEIFRMARIVLGEIPNAHLLEPVTWN